MTTEDLMKAVLDKLDQVAADSKKDLAEFRHETRQELSDMRSTMSDMSVTQARQQVILEEHIRRTEINEEALELHQQVHDKDIKAVSEKLEPLKTNAAMWAGAGKVLTVLVGFGTIVTAIIKIVEMLHK